MERKAAILGLGLMGASLCLALRRRGAWKVSGYARRPLTREQAVKGGFLDEVHDDPAAAVRDADLVVAAGPVFAIPGIIASCVSGLKPGCVVTDVGSTKASLEASCAPLVKDAGALFIGSHPICGSEQTGIEAAREDLYEDALVVVTPGSSAPPDMVQRTCAFWESVGSRVYVMPAAEHDAMLARTSHLPHFTSVLLALAVGREGQKAGRFSGTGFRGASRLASGSPEVWKDISESNAAPILDELKAFRAELDRLVVLFEKGDFNAIEQVLSTARSVREELIQEREQFLKELGL